jgi:hypothetical protein
MVEQETVNFWVSGFKSPLERHLEILIFFIYSFYLFFLFITFYNQKNKQPESLMVKIIYVCFFMFVNFSEPE